MEIKTSGTAGTLESSDIMIAIERNDDEKTAITLKSSVEKQFGDQIRQVIADTLSELGICNAKVTATDKGALDCTIRARVLTAVHRACENEDYKWGDK